MKNFLAIDTSSKYMTVLAAKEGQTFFSHTPDCAMRHSVRLMGAIDGVLKEAKLSLDECDFFRGRGRGLVYGDTHRDCYGEGLLPRGGKTLSARHLV
ncbi:MAG: hypothetical protein ACLR06_00895 [Christensenellaceae bacterium]